MKFTFKRDTSFRKQFFVPDSFAHPAKMDAQLLIWIVERYTEAGETILDPMAGSGTMMLACTLGRNVVLVELEEKFCKMMRDNWQEVQMRPQLGSQMGNCQIIQGDARQLEGLVDVEIFSPPYAETLQGSGADAARKRISEGKYKGLRPDVWTSKGNVAGSTFGDGYSRDPNAIGNLPYGQIDKIVTSPPYEGTEARDRSKEDSFEREKSGKYPKRGDLNISSGYQADSIITSPPYEAAGFKADENPANVMKREAKRREKFPMRPAVVPGRYSDDYNNIGNLKSNSYLEAMALVYQQCYKVLRDGGLMVLVVKNFIRNKQVVRLDTDTIKLCEQAGFTYLERHYRKLPGQSFWRIIYHQKYPDVEQILNEDVLVFKKL